MSEQMEVVGTESTTSMAATEGTETDAAALGAVETTVATEGKASGEGTTPPPAETDGATQQTAEDDNPMTISVPFNHENRELTLAEAQSYAQKGMKMDALTPTLDRLRLMAAADGKSLKNFVEDLYGIFEDHHRSDILRECGGNETAADALMEKKRAEWNAGFTAAKDAEAKAEEDGRKALEDRLASEFLEIANVFPEIKEFADVPKEVVHDAVKNGRNLYDAFLRYQQKESKAATQNQQAQQRAAAASTGSQADTSNGVSAATAALLGGLGRALR